MTIKEAVELYNQTNKKINGIRSLVSDIAKRQRDPLGLYLLTATDMQEIADYLSEYITILKQRLEDTFES